MLVCTVYRIHRLGKALPDHARVAVTGIIDLRGGYLPQYRRDVLRLQLLPVQYSPVPPNLIPPLHDPLLMAFGSCRGMSVSGHEEIDDRRYYQSWWVQWEWSDQHPDGDRRLYPPSARDSDGQTPVVEVSPT